MFRRWHNAPDPEENDAMHQEAKVTELKNAIGPLSGLSLQFCNDACLRRYLEARNWNLDKSKKMLEDTLKWRATFKPEEIRWHEVANEGETGKVYRANFHDRHGRTVLILRPGKQNTTSHDNQLRHLVYLIENAILNLPEGQEQMMWLIDFTGWSLTNSVPIKTARETVNILQNHYPERLAMAFLYNPPRIFETFWKILIYCRSSVPPVHQWPAKEKLFTLDVVYLHDKPNPENCPQKVYDALVDALEHVSEFEGYIFESGQGLARVLFRHMCVLLAHPQQRCVQDYIDVPKSIGKKSTATDVAPGEEIIVVSGQ